MGQEKVVLYIFLIDRRSANNVVKKNRFIGVYMVGVGGKGLGPSKIHKITPTVIR